jgi:hypothetical protein
MEEMKNLFTSDCSDTDRVDISGIDLNYLLVNELIKKNIHKIKQNFIKTRPSYLTKPNKDRIVENQTIMDILSEYENLSKVIDLKRHYSTSEIFKMAEIDMVNIKNIADTVRTILCKQGPPAPLERF